MKIILYQPQIPQNTGNIIRTCSVTNTDLILVKPLGFKTDSKRLKRAGLDYFENVNVLEIDDLFLFLENTKYNFYFFSSKATKKYSEISFKKDDLLIFGSENFGVDIKFSEMYKKNFHTIPMLKNSRCLNLATSCGIVLFEAYRQLNFNFTS